MDLRGARIKVLTPFLLRSTPFLPRLNADYAQNAYNQAGNKQGRLDTKGTKRPKKTF